jgi:hypothetical protein
VIKNWTKFIKESSFLKNINYLGFIDLNVYDKYEIIKILYKYNEDDYLLDKNTLLFNFDNSELEDELNSFIFKQETNNIFNIKYLESATRTPIELDKFLFKDFINNRINHYMIKSNDSTDLVFGEIDSDSIKQFVNYCIEESKKLDLNWSNRYCYITIDQKDVIKDKSQREAGWHIDGMQGDEVNEKKPADFQFIWSDETPTKFCTQLFNTQKLDTSIHNVFNFLGNQVKNETCYLLEKNKIYLMNAYHLHTATLSNKNTHRKFVRVSFTNTPITSIKMTINNSINYNYKIHQTTGNIPKNLI